MSVALAALAIFLPEIVRSSWSLVGENQPRFGAHKKLPSAASRLAAPKQKEFLRQDHRIVQCNSAGRTNVLLIAATVAAAHLATVAVALLALTRRRQPPSPAAAA